MTNKLKKVINIIIIIFMSILSLFLFLVGVALASEEESVLYLIVFSGLSVFMFWGAVSVYRISKSKERAGKRKKTDSSNKQDLIKKNSEKWATENKIYCTKCGKENKRTSKFCTNCGESLEIKYIKNSTEINIPDGVTRGDDNTQTLFEEYSIKKKSNNGDCDRNCDNLTEKIQIKKQPSEEEKMYEYAERMGLMEDYLHDGPHWRGKWDYRP